MQCSDDILNAFRPSAYAMNVLCLSAEKGVSEYLHEVPEWHLTDLHEKLALELQSL